MKINYYNIMTDSNNNSDKKNKNIFQKYIDLLNSIILSLKNNSLTSLEELSNEYKVYSLILEIEPKFEKTPINNKVELLKDSNLETRNNNFISIFTAVVNYKNESKTKDKFTKETNFIKSINIKDLLNNEKDQLIKIAEMLCFLTIISSNKNYFIEKVNEIDDNQISNLYYTIIEKYITFKIDESTTSVVKKTNIFSNQMQNIKTYNIKNENDIKYNELMLQNEDASKFNTSDNIKIINTNKTIIIKGFDEMIKENEEEVNKNKNKRIINNENFEQEKEKILMQIKIDNLNKELSKMKEKYQNFEKEKKLLENSLNELKEINNNLINNSAKEEQKNNDKIIIEEQNTINNLTKELNEAHQQIDILKNENEKLSNNINEINTEKQKLEKEKEKIDTDMQQLKLENEKLKEEQKIKEENYNQVTLNNKNIIEKYKNDLDLQMQLNERLNEEKEIMQLEIEKYKLEINNNNNIINQNKEINNIIEEKSNNIAKENELKIEIEKLKYNLVEKDEKIKQLEEINLEKEKDKGDDIHFYKKSYEEQKLRVNEEHKLISESLYKLAIHFMTLKDDLQKRINSANSEK